MQTVDKAMNLLGFFSTSRTEIGLNELSRLAELDRAATRRYLVALSKHGLIEQKPADKKYRMGSALLRLACIREATVPFMSIIRPALEELVAELQETTHACLYSDGSMATIAIAEPERSTRVYVNPTQPLPLHATASGLAYISFLDEDALIAILRHASLQKHTATTATTKRELLKKIEETRRRGYARAEQSFEDEVVGTAMPIFDATGKPFATIAVAAVASRFSREIDAEIVKSLRKVAREVTNAVGGEDQR